MHSTSYIAALGALLSAVAAVPMKRDMIINTVTQVDVVTEYMTATVWVDAPNATPTYHEAHYSHEQHHPTSTVSTSSALPTTSSAVYVAPPPPAPTTTSTSSSTSSSTTVQPPPVYSAPPAPAPYVPATTSTTEVPAPAPTTSTSQYVPPAYTPPPAPTTISTTAAAPASTPASGSSGSYSGDITYYAVGLGSCGETNTDSENVVAMAHGMMNKATMCGKTITLNYNGVSQQAKVVDTCMSCVDGDLDLSPSLFKAIAPNGDGRVKGVSWSWN